MTVKLVGTDDTTPAGYGAANYLTMCRFQAIASGNMIQFYIHSGGIGNIKCALYADNGGEPGSLITAMNTGQSLTTGWISVNFMSTAITLGTYYWLACVFDSAINPYLNAGTGTRRYKLVTYSTFTFPDPAGTGYTADTYNHVIAGWGDNTITLNPSSISQSLSYGSPKLNLTITPSSILSSLGYGIPSIIFFGNVIAPQGISAVVSCGAPNLRYIQMLLPQSIVQYLSIGTPWVGIFGFIKPQGTIQQVSIGSPALYKYVWHVILDGQYATETPDKNRMFIIGRDQYGNLVWGEAHDSAESALVGERLDFQHEIAIPTESQAAGMASAILAKMRLTKAKGVILIPPNCGQELWDLIEISDRVAAQNIHKYRINGIQLIYDHKSGEYYQRLRLAGV
jgi:hypothetical protein